MGLTKEQLDLRTNRTMDIKAVQPKDGKPFIFISYKSDDWELVLDTIVRKLYEEYQLNVYFDNNFEKSNDSWVESMSKAITSEFCKGIIAFVSKEYMKSYACLMELLQPFTEDSRAIWKDKPMGIIPVLLYGLDSIGKAKEKLPLDVSPAEVEKWNKLFKNVDRRLNRDMKRNNSKMYDDIYDVFAPMMTGDTENSVRNDIKMNQISNLMEVLLGGNEAYCRRYSDSNEGFYDNLIEAIKDLKDSDNRVEDMVFKNINPEEKDDKNSTTSSAPQEKDDKNSTTSSAPQEKDDKDSTASPTIKVIDDKTFTISGKALNDYKHLAEVFLKTYERIDPKRIECFTAQMVNSSEKLVWELNKKNGRSWMLKPQQNGYPHQDILEGELLTAIETLASNFRSINKYLREIPLNYDSLFNCTGADYELLCKEATDRSKIGKGNVLVSIRELKSVRGKS